VGGRATSPKGKSLDEIVRKAASSHLTKTVRYLQEYNIEPRTKEGSPELRSLIGKGANDTSIGVGYAPLSPTESLVLDLEKLVWKVKGTGEDTKIMAVRRGRDLQLVVAVAMVSRHIGSMEEYLEAKEKVKEAILAKVNAQVAVNAADQGDNIFLTVTGTSVEMGDDGATGRGNRGNGLITPMRPMTMEAIAGKNPVSHVGKIYNVLAKKAAQEIAELEGVKEAYVTLVSRIGSPIDCPMVKGAKVALDDAGFPKVSEGKINEILDYWVDQVEETAEEFVAGKIAVF
jgi:S-adenosylmethionine synthetase